MSCNFDNMFIAVVMHDGRRITKDPKSVDFWTHKLGMTLLKTDENQGSISFFLAYPQPQDNGKEVYEREGVLELVYKGDTEINNGNGETNRGFGHVCVSVDNIEAAEKKFLLQGVRFKKKLSQGRQHDIAFVLSDFDDYWIELIENGIDKKENETNVASYRFNHTMIRVVDVEKSLKFYRDLGLKLVNKLDFKEAKFSLYFLAYYNDDNFEQGTMQYKDQTKLQSLIELTYNWEADPEFKGYNLGPQGFQNIAISGDNIKDHKYVEDPDTYKVELKSL
ncbi:GLO1 [Candida oxycetoniae]|uniref:GLO1 n=1 Tax=Candida oxycetoniae TaxID=497107 RepID=A0AAI9SYZ7_9ASCO|nr:GLO1 [Candida oxycetoniae]KAI3405375.1 GLO1 [Candida oxycetoniae]